MPREKVVLVPGMPELALAQFEGSGSAREVALLEIDAMGLREECAHYFDGTTE